MEYREGIYTTIWLCDPEGNADNAYNDHYIEETNITAETIHEFIKDWLKIESKRYFNKDGKQLNLKHQYEISKLKEWLKECKEQYKHLTPDEPEHEECFHIGIFKHENGDYDDFEINYLRIFEEE